MPDNTAEVKIKCQNVLTKIKQNQSISLKVSPRGVRNGKPNKITPKFQPKI